MRGSPHAGVPGRGRSCGGAVPGEFPRPDVIAATTTAMMTASGLGHVDVVRALLDRRISPFQRQQVLTRSTRRAGTDDPR